MGVERWRFARRMPERRIRASLLWQEGGSHPRMLSIGLHPRLVGQASRAHALAEFIDHVRARGGAWFATRLEIARWWQANHEAFAAQG